MLFFSYIFRTNYEKIKKFKKNTRENILITIVFFFYRLRFSRLYRRYAAVIVVVVVVVVIIRARDKRNE